MKSTSKKIIIGMSGGVDSSVAALVLLQQGYNVEGLFMKNWEEDDGSEYCTAKQDLDDAKNVCEKLKIKLHVANFAAEYWDNVFELFLKEYKSGRTPNPDILCNKEIKFKVFLEYALELGADFIATGHYCNRIDTKGHSYLANATDKNKDQTYFLYALTEQQISKALFPLGSLVKDEVRKLAKDHDLPVYNKKDSTGICFIGERRFKDFLQRYIKEQPGKIITTAGEEIGRHNGLMFYTVGQRQGIGIGGLKNSTNKPWYVVNKDMQNNLLIVAQGQDHPALYASTLICETIHWINNSTTITQNLEAKIRYRQDNQQCQITKLENDSYKVNFTTPQRAITPGQSIVFYHDGICLGGAIIQQAVKIS